MEHKGYFDRAFSQVEESFPFPGYLDSHCYYQLKAIVEILGALRPLRDGVTLLDVGSGPMDKTAVFQAMGLRCCAVDDLGDPWHRLPGNTEIILEFARASGIEFFHQFEGSVTIPFPKEHFDIVTSIAVIEHLHETPRLVLNAMGEHLRTGGLLVVAMPNSVNLRKRLSVLFGRTNYNPVEELYYSLGPYRGHVREYTLAETSHICELNGFRIRHAGTFEHLAQEKLPQGLRQLYALVGNIVPTTRSGLLVIAEKPDGWRPAAEDPERYFRAIGGAVPKNLIENFKGQAKNR